MVINIEKIQEEKKNVKKAVREKFMTSIIAALGLVVGLAWNDAVKSLIETIFPMSEGGILAKFIYAVILTLFIAVFAYYISKWFTAKEEEV